MTNNILARRENHARIDLMLTTFKPTILLLLLAIPCMAAKPVLSEGFQLKTLYEVPKKQQGSWVAMTVDDKGRLIVSDQYGSLYRVTLKDGDQVAVEEMPVKMGGAQGLLWFGGKLYVSVAAKDKAPMGLYVISDKNGDGELEEIKLLKKFNGGGEHGPHGLVASPDGKWIYVVAGNHTNVPEVDHFHATNKWGEDHLLPSQPDARGHARTRKAPGGWIVRFRPDGTQWELFSQGYRNAYDIAFDSQGELFTYDADMEWDLGTSWYRPTRICHATSGSEFGWRTGTGKWPDYYLDSRPSVVDIGPGSPAGLLSGKGAKFPTRYQDALFALDWTFATIYAIHLKQDGASYVAEKEEFLTSTGMPLTDAVIGKDGAMYVLTGGRRTDSALHRITYHGKESLAEPSVTKATELTILRRKLDALHEKADPSQLDTIWKNLGHADSAIRYSARVALEHLSVQTWAGKVATIKAPKQLFQAAVAIAHQGEAKHRENLLGNLADIDFSKLDREGKLELLRAQGLLIARNKNLPAATSAKMLKQLDPHFPAKERMVNRELCRTLCYLQSPTVVEKTLSLIASDSSPVIPDWAVLARRNAKYGKSIVEMLNNQPSSQNQHYVYCLRVVKGPWTAGQRRQYFTWYQTAAKKSGGLSYKGFLNNLRKDAMANATPKERKMIEDWKLVVTHNPFANLPKIKGPGKNWKVSDITALGDLKGADMKHGERMFRASLCAACHQVKGKGGGSGPDLSNAANRFQLKDFAEAIIEPNKVVSDQYEFSIISKKDGSFVTGKVLEEKDGFYIVATNAFDLSATIEIPEGDIKGMKPSPTSPMPPALINRLNEKELRDLMGYLMSLK